MTAGAIPGVPGAHMLQAAGLCRAPHDAAACAAGSHALGAVAALLVLALAAAWLLARGASRPSVAPGRAGRRARVLGAAIAVALLVFAVVAWGVTRGGAFDAADRAFSESARGALSPSALQFFASVTWLGNGSVLALLCAGAALSLFVRGERWLAIGVVLAVGGNGLLDAGLKRIFVRVRPPPDGVLPQLHGWSFPSGHAAGAMVAYGFLAYVALGLLPPRLRAPSLMLCAALVLLVGASRVFLNAHYAGDVLAGLASGAAWLLACILAVERARRPPRQGSSLGSARSSLSSTSPT